MPEVNCWMVYWRLPAAGKRIYHELVPATDGYYYLEELNFKVKLDGKSVGVNIIGKDIKYKREEEK